MERGRGRGSMLGSGLRGLAQDARRLLLAAATAAEVSDQPAWRI